MTKACGRRTFDATPKRRDFRPGEGEARADQRRGQASCFRDTRAGRYRATVSSRRGTASASPGADGSLEEGPPPPKRRARAAAPRRVDNTLLHRTLRTQLETFVEEAARTGRPLPDFVERELRAFVDCDIAANGFVRVHCSGCGHDRLLPFSCKRRGFCPSCGGRRMSEGAAHLVDRVLPRVPLRRWPLSFAFALRVRLAMNHRLTSRVLGVAMRAIMSFQRARARRLFGVPEGRCGAVTVVQRFGSALNLNVHFHCLVLDGVHLVDESGRIRFQSLPAPRRGELLLLVETIAQRANELLEGEGMFDGDDESDDEESRLTRSCQAAAARGVTRIGPRAGQRPCLLIGETHDRARRPPDSCRAEGFDLHVGARIRGNDRDRMERLSRYALRPPPATERLTELPDSRLKYELRQPWRDGRRAVPFEPLELIERLAALIPAPRGNLVRYHGTLAPGSNLHSRIVLAGLVRTRRRTESGRETAQAQVESAPAEQGALTLLTHPTRVDDDQARERMAWREAAMLRAAPARRKSPCAGFAREDC